MIIFFLDKEFWLGLDNIYALTDIEGKQMQLRIEMEKFNREKAIAYYDDFFLEALSGNGSIGTVLSSYFALNWLQIYSSLIYCH